MPHFTITHQLEVGIRTGFFLPEEYAKLILRSEPDFVEAKGYSLIWGSRLRLPSSSVILVEDLKGFAEELAKDAGYVLKDVDSDSRVALFTK